MAQPSEYQVYATYGQFFSVIDATGTQSEYNVYSLEGQFFSVIDATDTGAAAGFAHSFGVVMVDYYAVAAAASTISSHSTLGTGLVHYYDLDADATDIVGTADLTVSGATLTTSSGGKLGECYDFDGVNDDLNLPNYTTLIDGSADFSYAFWFKPDTLPTGTAFKCCLSFRGEFSHTVIIRAGGGNVNIQSHMEINSTSVQLLGTTYLSAGTWYHVVVTYSTTNGTELFVNSVSEATNSTTGTYTTVSQSSNLGSYHNSFYFDGLIDEFGIWSKVLSQSEIDDLYNSGSGLPYD